MTIFITFVIAVITFQINHRIKKMTDIKILINTLFELYGNSEAFEKFNKEEVSSILMQEILNIEKQYDNNPYIKNQVKKLEQLRLIYFDQTKTIEDLKLINFQYLGRDFILLAYLNLR